MDFGGNPNQNISINNNFITSIIRWLPRNQTFLNNFHFLITLLTIVLQLNVSGKQITTFSRRTRERRAIKKLIWPASGLAETLTNALTHYYLKYQITKQPFSNLIPASAPKIIFWQIFNPCCLMNTAIQLPDLRECFPDISNDFLPGMVPTTWWLTYGIHRYTNPQSCASSWVWVQVVSGKSYWILKQIQNEFTSNRQRRKLVIANAAS